MVFLIKHELRSWLQPAFTWPTVNKEKNIVTQGTSLTKRTNAGEQLLAHLRESFSFAIPRTPYVAVFLLNFGLYDKPSIILAREQQ